MQLSETFNIQNIKSNHTSIAKVLLVFYVLIASSCTDGLMAKQMREYIKDNKFMQHIIGFLTMIVLVSMIGGVVDTRSIILYALIGYVWFILSTKLDIHWNIIILSLLFIGFMYENSIEVRETELQNDVSLNDIEKQKILSEDIQVRNWIVGSIIIVTIIGTVFYSHKKHEQYGGGYDVFAYMLK